MERSLVFLGLMVVIVGFRGLCGPITVMVFLQFGL